MAKSDIVEVITAIRLRTERRRCKLPDLVPLGWGQQRFDGLAGCGHANGWVGHRTVFGISMYRIAAAAAAAASLMDVACQRPDRRRRLLAESVPNPHVVVVDGAGVAVRFRGRVRSVRCQCASTMGKEEL